MDKLNTISLDDFLNDSLNEDKLHKVYSKSHLSAVYNKYKKELKLSDKLSVQIYTNNHVDQHFEDRFVSGEFILRDGKKRTAFKNLDGWKPLKKIDFSKVVLNGLNKIITDHAMEIGGYFIISESTRMVIPMIVGKIEGEEHLRCCIINTVLHTAMSCIDTFNFGLKKYDSDKVKVERKIDDFYNHLLEYYKESLGVLEDSEIKDDDSGMLLEYTIEGEHNVNTNYPVIVVE